MSSTRLKNQPGEYKLEQLRNQQACANRLSEHRTISNNTVLPEFGFNVSYLPNHLLSKNAVDIESNLFGVGASNLEKKPIHFNPYLNRLKDISFFERPEVFVPPPLTHSLYQRPVIP